MITKSGNSLELVPMEQLAEAKATNDDWTGLSNSKERRKRQNRLNQRAHRRRKAIGSRASTASIPEPPKPASPPTPLAPFNRGEPSRVNPKYASVYFPLTADHSLLYIVSFNISRAVLTNWDIICTSSGIFTNSYSCCSTSVPTMLPSKDAHDIIPLPQTLEPTFLQFSTPHPLWVDLLPLPQLRDNVIQAVSKQLIDADEFIEDLIGDLFNEMDFCGNCPPECPNNGPNPASSVQGKTGIIAWADPWTIEGWEVTEDFAKKWAFMLEGCQQVIDATNKWRTLRGEDPLVVEV